MLLDVSSGTSAWCPSLACSEGSNKSSNIAGVYAILFNVLLVESDRRIAEDESPSYHPYNLKSSGSAEEKHLASPFSDPFVALKRFDVFPSMSTFACRYTYSTSPKQKLAKISSSLLALRQAHSSIVVLAATTESFNLHSPGA